MSALTILIVVIATVHYTVELQTDSILNDVITWLNGPEGFIKMKRQFRPYEKAKNINFKKYLETVIKNTAKKFQDEDINKLSYYNQINWDNVGNQPLKIHNEDREANNKEVLNQYLTVKPPWFKPVPMKRKPNYQLDKGHGGNNLYEDARNNDLPDYSKIFLVLNPEANLEKSDIMDIGNLVSSMLSKSNINHKSSKEGHPKRLYKGFVIRDVRRRNRESKEAIVSKIRRDVGFYISSYRENDNGFAPKESMEHEHKPKRGRNEYSGSRGRTGIPYVRQRGDVYERE